MKAALACAGTLVLAVLAAMIFGAEDGLGGRVRGYFDPVPRATAEEPPPVSRGLSRDEGSAGPGATPAWRVKDREGWGRYEAGEFAAAAAAWDEASALAPPAASHPLHARADRSRLFGLLAGGPPPAEGTDPATAEADYRRLMDTVDRDDPGAWLEVAAFAVDHGLRHHLAFLFEQAYERRQGKGGDAVAKRASAAIRAVKAGGGTTAPEVLESVIRELPASEAADLAREETGGGFSATARRGEASSGGVDMEKLEKARDLVARGDAEYRQAVPGSKDVNVHRRKALDLYTEARALYQVLDDNRGAYASRIHELNRNIAELHKDLPIGK